MPHPHSSVEALLHAGTYIAGIVDQLYLGTIVADNLAPLLAHRVWHYDHSLIAPDCPYKGKAYSLITAGRLHNHRVLVYNTALLRIQNHIPGGAGLYGATNVEPLKLNQHPGRVCAHHPIQLDKRCVSHCIKDCPADHVVPPSSLKVVQILNKRSSYVANGQYVFPTTLSRASP